MRFVPFHMLLAASVLALPVSGEPGMQIPDDFPRFNVPGREDATAALRELYWLHYQRSGPLATLWDEWMTTPTLWPAVATGNRTDDLHARWAQVLSSRQIDAEGYVATHQHTSIAHQQGWPFPFWAQGGAGAWGWHFSLHGIHHAWHGTQEKTQEGWELINAEDKGIAERVWNVELTGPGAAVRTPPLEILPHQAPFIQFRWKAEGMDHAQPYLEWTTQDAPEFSPQRRLYFEPVTPAQGIVYTHIPVFRHPEWRGTITRLGVNFDNPPGAKVGVRALFTTYDTRHNINNQCFIRGGCYYFWWTRDLNFLRGNIQRMRLALGYLMDDLGGREHRLILTPWVGHDGRSGLELKPDGSKVVHGGRGIGNNYWDLLPMGHKDAYATIQYYDTLRLMARLERQVADHPEWNIPGGPLRCEPESLLEHAREVKDHAGRLFWNDGTGRFVCAIDIDGRGYDYGFTFLNLEAIHYDFATPAQADAIMQWLEGRRTIDGDTSQGEDIYHWRFAPRATTRRNVEYYFWAWNAPETIPFGGQVQDGGAVLGFSYHDLMARLQTRGPDSAWHRLREIVAWFQEVQNAGGYREYYKDGTRGTLQGGGTAGGLGLDQEFYESILVPQVVINGFLGLIPRGDGFELNPRLPADWPSLTVTRIQFHRLVLDITADRDTITITPTAGHVSWPLFVYPPAGSYEVRCLNAQGEPVDRQAGVKVARGEGVKLESEPGNSLQLRR